MLKRSTGNGRALFRLDRPILADSADSADSETWDTAVIRPLLIFVRIAANGRDEPNSLRASVATV